MSSVYCDECSRVHFEGDDVSICHQGHILCPIPCDPTIPGCGKMLSCCGKVACLDCYTRHDFDSCRIEMMLKKINMMEGYTSAILDYLDIQKKPVGEFNSDYIEGENSLDLLSDKISKLSGTQNLINGELVRLMKMFDSFKSSSKETSSNSG